jgi:hypothetical protein
MDSLGCHFNARGESSSGIRFAKHGLKRTCRLAVTLTWLTLEDGRYFAAPVNDALKLLDIYWDQLYSG